MKPQKKQCQAYSKSSSDRCVKKPLFGSRYCLWHQSWGINAIGIVLAFILFLFAPFYDDVFNYYLPSDADLKSEKRDNEHSLKLDELLALQGNENARKEYLETIQKLSKSNFEKLSKQSDVQLNKDLILEQRENLQKTEEIKDEIVKKAAVKFELKYTPAIYQILGLLDIEMQKWQEKGYITNIESKKLPIYVLDTHNSKDTIRKYTLKDGSFIEVIQLQGIIQSDNSMNPLDISIRFGKPMHDSIKLFDLSFNHSDMNIADCITTPNDQFNIFKTDKKPLEEDGFFEVLPTIIQKIKGYALTNSKIEI